NFRLGINGTYGLSMGKLDLLFQVGGYAYTAYEDNGYIYSKLGSRYYLTDKLFVNLALKTHFAVADFIEYGVGYRLH
ncbi:MAG: acyloxyacyl hydrolase, partial [Flavobacteriales bacterium]|nr:acyloxyacyl hydrolase [Flavobacteriales bacterium]